MLNWILWSFILVSLVMTMMIIIILFFGHYISCIAGLSRFLEQEREKGDRDTIIIRFTFGVLDCCPSFFRLQRLDHGLMVLKRFSCCCRSNTASLISRSLMFCRGHCRNLPSLVDSLACGCLCVRAFYTSLETINFPQHQKTYVSGMWICMGRT